MASRPVSAAGGRATGSGEKSYFEQQREELIGEIAMVCTDFVVYWVFLIHERSLSHLFAAEMDEIRYYMTSLGP